MTPKFLIIVIILIFINFPSRSQGEDDISAWLSERRLIIENVKSGSGGIAEVEKLGSLVSGLGKNQKNLRPEVKKIYLDGINALISNPSHLEYFSSRISALTEEEIAGTSKAHQLQRGWYFENLTQLRTPQTVKILGELVFDERDPWKDGDWGDGGRPYANSFHAVKALHKLGLKDPPVTRNHPDVYGDVRTWQLWYEQVRAGTRTFSFKGDDTIYALTGPVKESRQPRLSSSKNVSPAPADHMERPSAWKLALAALGALLALLALLFAALRKPAKHHST